MTDVMSGNLIVGILFNMSAERLWGVGFGNSMNFSLLMPSYPQHHHTLISKLIYADCTMDGGFIRQMYAGVWHFTVTPRPSKRPSMARRSLRQDYRTNLDLRLEVEGTCIS